MKKLLTRLEMYKFIGKKNLVKIYFGSIVYEFKMFFLNNCYDIILAWGVLGAFSLLLAFIFPFFNFFICSGVVLGAIFFTALFSSIKNGVKRADNTIREGIKLCINKLEKRLEEWERERKDNA